MKKRIFQYKLTVSKLNYVYDLLSDIHGQPNENNPNLIIIGYKSQIYVGVNSNKLLQVQLFF